MFTKLTNMICIIKYALYGVKLNAPNFILSCIDDNLLKTMPDINQMLRFIDVMNLVVLLLQPAFLPICVINDAGDKWRKRLCVGYSCESMATGGLNLQCIRIATFVNSPNTSSQFHSGHNSNINSYLEILILSCCRSIEGRRVT